VERRLVYWAFAGFIVLSVFGTLLRAMFVLPIPLLNYSFLLHAHSHFGFSGLVFLSLALLVVKAISPEGLKNYRAVFILTLISAFGMLVAFSLQGYKAVSIIFSTLFIVTNYYFAYKLFHDRNFKAALTPLSHLLLKSALVFLCLSSLGPFSLEPLVLAGYKATPLYNDAIYFYLHFQMNGWMLCAALGLFANTYAQNCESQKAKLWATIFVLSTAPLYFLFTLWGSPPQIVRWLAFAGAAFNLISWIKLLQSLRLNYKSLPILIKVALLGILLKVIFQVPACFPPIGDWVFSNRNLIIGYIHLLTLGIIMPIILQLFVSSGMVKATFLFQKLNLLFIATTVLYLLVLFVQPAAAFFNVSIPNLQIFLLAIAIIFLLVGVAYMFAVKQRNNSDNPLNIGS
jgi:hypothetical protein